MVAGRRTTAPLPAVASCLKQKFITEQVLYMAYWCAKHLSIKYTVRSKFWGLWMAHQCATQAAASLLMESFITEQVPHGVLVRKAFINEVHTPE